MRTEPAPRNAYSASATNSASGIRGRNAPNRGRSTTAASGAVNRFRVFPLSNWTELDIWRYIELENIELPSIYFAAQRDVFERDGILLTVSPFTHPRPEETVNNEWVRYRTVGDLTITGAVRSTATTLPEIIAEVSEATVSERGETRADDRTSSAAMEDRKREGYF